MEPTWPAGMVVVVPVYNHVATVGAVVASARAAGAEVLCIDDGSTDGSGAAAAAAGAQVRRLEPNQGKGAALVAGLRWAESLGFRQALTCDADGQHPPEAVATLAQAAATEPAAIHVGSRDMAGAPGSSRFGKWWTNLWIRIAAGIDAFDGQSGLRVYPIPLTNQLQVQAGRYAFEVEVLVRAAWAGIAVRGVAVPVRYPADRISHFHKLRDNARTAWTFTRLVTRRCLPWPHRRLVETPSITWATTLRGLLGQGLSPVSAGAACALGAAIGVAPIPGAQMGVAAWLAWRLSLNVPLTLLASNVSFGPLLFAFFAMEIALGHWINTGEHLFGDLSGLAGRIESDAAHGIWSAVWPWLADWLVGSLPVMTVMAVLAGITGWAVAAAIHRGSRLG
ncbi:hypothetical protein LBMAG53_13120 [Planctomycetota bacterium]|nr:hypothetical protein LBMAG53_13120 [Planctomycetota bacterium]